jgi:hypothetical protein
MAEANEDKAETAQAVGGPSETKTLYCTFCFKSQHQVKMLIPVLQQSSSAMSAYICAINASPVVFRTNRNRHLTKICLQSVCWSGFGQSKTRCRARVINSSGWSRFFGLGR